MNNKMPKVGVVIVSYNASEATRITLASLRRAVNKTAFKLILIDNKSEPFEREKIHADISRHIAKFGSSWCYIEQEKNLGFAGGNNVGISKFLADEEISHICLLNSDVVVTDHWLDRLLANGSDIVSAVTNRADSEQCVPIDYQVEISECLDESSGELHDAAYSRISDFAERWYKAWSGNSVEVDPTFFCVLLTRKACCTIGLLDEAFFPGGYEDDDYCLRARQAGYQPRLARDVFIHHWGSASFGQLQYEYFSKRALCNKEYLEKKHGFIWQRRPEKPITALTMDLGFALQQKKRLPLQKPFIENYLKNSAKQIDYFESESLRFENTLATSDCIIPETLAHQIAAAKTYGDLREIWKDVNLRIKDALSSNENIEAITSSIISDLTQIAKGIHEKVECNFAIHSFMTGMMHKMHSPQAATPKYPANRIGRFFWFLRYGLNFILKFNGIVFFGGYFYPERQSDGYFQRIQIIDRLFADRWRIYVETSALQGRNLWLDRPEQKVLVLRVVGSRIRRIFVRLLAFLTVLRSRKIYFHSVLRMHDNRFGLLLRLPFIRKVVDIHGVVPEEFRMHNDFFSAMLFEKQEKLAVNKAGLIVAVTNAMALYLQQKFRSALKGKIATFPMFPDFTPTLSTRPLIDGKPVVVYAGGLHKWQQVSKMIDAIIKTADRCIHRFYCPEPQIVEDMLPPTVASVVTVESKTHSELVTLYPECHYGFILREDSIVNRVACPTKLVEYLAMGVVPIVDCDDLGDFKALGMRSIPLNEFLAGQLPDEEQRLEMATTNFAVYESLKKIRQTGAKEIKIFFETNRINNSSLSFMSRLRRMLPPETLAGRVARRIRRAYLSMPSANNDISTEIPKQLTACDILVQVDNFEAGGLENVVIDLNRTLVQAGYRVMLLVLGHQGAAVKRARDLGQTVICCTYADKTYTILLDQLQPKLLLTHYSIQGISLCRQRSIPFVQVIHNIYMWFDDQQRRKFAEAAAMTTTFVAVSDYARRYSISRLGVAPEKCVVIPNGINLDPYKSMDKKNARSRLRAQHGITDEEFVFLDIGAINYQKNHFGMIKAFEIALHTCINSRLLILGSCYETGLLKKMLDYVEKQGLQEKVLYCGSTTSVYEYFAMAEAFASASFFEGGQLTWLEAIAANIPIVTSAVGFAANFAERQGIRLVEPVYDMMHFNGAIWEMKSTPEFEQRLAEAMICTWKEPLRPNFSATELAALERERTYENYIHLISKIISEKGTSNECEPVLKVV